jgi:hypothetical protein
MSCLLVGYVRICLVALVSENFVRISCFRMVSIHHRIVFFLQDKLFGGMECFIKNDMVT